MVLNMKMVNPQQFSITFYETNLSFTVENERLKSTRNETAIEWHTVSGIINMRTL